MALSKFQSSCGSIGEHFLRGVAEPSKKFLDIRRGLESTVLSCAQFGLSLSHFSVVALYLRQPSVEKSHPGPDSRCDQSSPGFERRSGAAPRALVFLDSSTMYHSGVGEFVFVDTGDTPWGRFDRLVFVP